MASSERQHPATGLLSPDAGRGREVAAPASPWRPGTGRGVDGFFRLAQEASTERWWLIDPEGRPFFCRAVHDVRGPGEAGDNGLPPDSVARLRRWGFNALGTGAYPGGQDEGLPGLAVVDFLQAGPAIVAGEARLPDVFDASWPDNVHARARDVCAPRAEDRAILGWVTDDRLAWAAPSAAGRPSLLQLCLSLEPSFRAYHAAWEFVLAHHGGRLETVSRAWNVPLANKEVVRELTRADEGIGTRGYLRDEGRWTREFARRYFATTSAAIRAAAPNHLVLGARLGADAPAAVRAEGNYPVVDLPMVEWRDLPPVESRGGEPREPGVSLTGGPVLAGEVEWVSADFQKLPTAARLLRLTSLEWMMRRARTALDRMARHPAVVGYAWSRWQDEPGEQPPFGRGLVHANGAEAREHTELLAQFNRRVETVRRGAGNPSFQQ